MHVCMYVTTHTHTYTQTLSCYPLTHSIILTKNLSRAYGGKQPIGTLLITPEWTVCQRVLVIATKGKTGAKEPHHYALGIVTMSIPVVISYAESLKIVQGWPEHIVEQATTLLLEKPTAVCKAYALTDKVRFPQPVKCVFPRGPVNWVKTAVLVE